MGFRLERWIFELPWGLVIGFWGFAVRSFLTIYAFSAIFVSVQNQLHMTRKISSSAAFTLIEMLVVISIIVVLASFAVPAVISGLTKGQMVGTLNNARQLYLAGQQMALDGSTNGDTNLAWPGD